MKLLKLLRHRQVARILGLLMLDLILFTSTNVTTAPSIVSVVGFVLLVTTIYYIIYLGISLTKFYGLPVRHKRPLAIYLTVFVGIMLALKSVGELGPRDIVVILPLAIVGYLYSMYAKAGGRNLET